MKKALITGITGQDGSYLTELLLDKGYEVHGIIRRSSSFNTQRIDPFYSDPHVAGTRLFLHYGDLVDGASLARALRKAQPDEVYNLGAQSHVRVSFDQPIYTSDTVALGTLRLLEAIREYRKETKCEVRVYQAGSSEMFGNTPPPQCEASAFQPCSPYGVSKVAAHWHAKNYRDAYGMFVANGILFNHESPRRGETFVTRKITRALGRICVGLQDKLYLGNLDATRDWGFAGDYVQAMWLMLQQDNPKDYVVATGVGWTVGDFLEEAFGVLKMDWRAYVVEDPRYLRPNEVESLIGDASRASEEMSWSPQTSFAELVRLMVDSDLEAAKRESMLSESR